MTRRNAQRGLSLIELMVTVVVLAILAAVALPNMADFFDKRRLISQAEAVANLIQFARTEAIKHPSSTPGDLVTATVKPAAPWFVGLRNGGACDNGGTPCKLNEGGNTGANAPTRVVIATECTGCTLSTASGNQEIIVFDLRGLVSGGTDQAITLQSPRGKQLSITVSALGRISVCSPGGSVSGYPSC